MQVELKDLKGNLVRCIIPYKDDEGNEKQIEVYNITGERRKQVFDNLSKIADNINELGINALEDYYIDLITEFTDVKLDKTSIMEIMESPRLEWNILMKELNDMVYELQYEHMIQLMSENRALIMTGMAAQMEKELEVFNNQIEKSNEMLKTGEDK